MGHAKIDLWDAWRTKRDDAAFETLVRPHLPALQDAARRHGLKTADAEDVVQEALLDLARHGTRKPADVGIGAWLMHAVRWKSSTLRRSAARRRLHERGHRGGPGASRAPARPDVHPPRLDVRDEVEQALAHLEEPDRQILAFRFLYDLDYREIAYVLGVSQGACRIRVHRASARLRQTLGSKALACLAAIPLPEPASSATWIATATAAAPAAGVGVGTLGGVVMGTAAKMAVAAVAAAAITSGAFLVAGPRDADAPPAPEPASTRHAAREVAESPPMLQGAAPRTLADLEPTEQEVVWLTDRLREERERLAASQFTRGDTGLRILRKVLDHDADPWPLLADFDALASHVESAPGAAHRVLATGPETVVDLQHTEKDVTVLEFGPGVFRVDGFPYRHQRTPMPHLEIRGAGVGETTLLLGSHARMMVLKPYENVRIHDLTLDFQGQSYLFDVRAQLAVVLEDVRIRDVNSWGLLVSGEAYIGCRRCEFVSTGDRSRAFALCFRGPGIAAFEGCLFVGVDAAIMGDRGGIGSRALFRECTFLDTPLTDSRIASEQHGPSVEVRVQGGTVHYEEGGLTEEKRRERWGAAFAASIEGTAFFPTQRAQTLEAMRLALDALQLPEGEILVSVALGGWLEGAPTSLTLNTFADDPHRTKVYTALPDDRGGWQLRHDPYSGGLSLGVSEGTSSIPDLERLLPHLDLPGDTVVESATLMAWQRRAADGSAQPPTWQCLVKGHGQEGWRFDPVTGARIDTGRRR